MRGTVAVIPVVFVHHQKHRRLHFKVNLLLDTSFPPRVVLRLGTITVVIQFFAFIPNQLPIQHHVLGFEVGVSDSELQQLDLEG